MSIFIIGSYDKNDVYVQSFVNLLSNFNLIFSNVDTFNIKEIYICIIINCIVL